MKQCMIYRELSHVKSSNNKVNNCYLPQVFQFQKFNALKKKFENGKHRFEPIQK